MSALDTILSWFNLRRITRTDRAPKRICENCERPIKRSGEPWVYSPVGPIHRQCPSLPTLPFTPAE